jgi:hypothetical protein
MFFIFLLFLFFTFLSSFPGDTSTCASSIDRSQSKANYFLSVAERQAATMSQSDLKAFQVHFGNDVEGFLKGFQIQRTARNE